MIIPYCNDQILSSTKDFNGITLVCIKFSFNFLKTIFRSNNAMNFQSSFLRKEKSFNFNSKIAQPNEREKSLSRFANYRAGKINRHRPETETTASHRRRNFFNNHSVRSARTVAVLERLIS